ncbi:MAG TPA: septal ring lytic transglycosylase RlpA family protein [Chitinophagaceae bacterium]|nr:septal ring lytic transglycosylase RlpA family protein [Chitinophagaceae bacterium]
MHLSIGIFVSFLFIFSGSVYSQNSSVIVKGESVRRVQYGTASFYSNKFNGRKTASGEIFSQQKMTAAHNSLPLGTYVKVTNLRNKRSVIVKINDRLHARNKRLLDLTTAAARRLGFVKAGLARVKLEILDKKPPKPEK